MQIFLLRHGQAEARSHDDSTRELTLQGRQDVMAVARQFAQRNIQPDCCLASPYARARQTAELFVAEAGLIHALELNEILVPSVGAVHVLQFLGSLQARRVLLISHNPLLSELGALLLEGSRQPLQVLRTSELLAIDCEVPGPGTGTVVFDLVANA